MNKNSIVTIAIVAVGGYALYWYLNSYGPNGAVSTFGGPGSYWASWFGGTASVSAPATTTGTPANTVSGSTQANQSPSGTSTSPTNQPSAPAMATAAQISQIQSLLQPSDLAAFSAMIPTLTYTQAAGMISNAGCVAASQAAHAADPYLPTMAYSLSANACVPGSNPTPGASPTTEALLISAAGGNNLLTVSQWNYYMTQGNPSAGIAPIDPNGSFPALNDGGAPMTAAAYLSLRAANGLSGIGQIMPVAPGITPAVTGLSGLGRVGNIMPLSPYITPANNGVRAGGAAGMGSLAGIGDIPVRTPSPWGKMPSRRIN